MQKKVAVVADRSYPLYADEYFMYFASEADAAMAVAREIITRAKTDPGQFYDAWESDAAKWLESQKP